jgi:hypothetical protein
MTLVRAPIRLQVGKKRFLGFFKGDGAATGTWTSTDGDEYLGIRPLWRLGTEQATSQVEGKGGDATKHDSLLEGESIPEFQSAWAGTGRMAGAETRRLFWIQKKTRIAIRMPKTVA